MVTAASVGGLMLRYGMSGINQGRDKFYISGGESERGTVGCFSLPLFFT